MTMFDDEGGATPHEEAATSTEVPAEVARGWFTSSGELSPRRAHLRRLADAGRLVIERMANTDVADDLIERAAELLEEAAAQLDGPGRVRRYDGFAESANAGGDPSPHFDHSPIFGMASPLAPPTQIEIGDDGRSVVLHVRYGTAYEGPPGSVHGGVVAAMFDEVLGMTQSLSGQPGMTGTLRIRYRRPTPLHRELRFEGTLDRVDGRKIFTTARCLDGDAVTAEAEGLFIHVDFQRLVDMVASRDGAAG
jgi:acyl-coenzyme A thioesterase PaaI-like protein